MALQVGVNSDQIMMLKLIQTMNCNFDRNSQLGLYIDVYLLIHPYE